MDLHRRHNNVNDVLTEDDAESLFSLMLGRSVNDDEFKSAHVRAGTTVSQFITLIMTSAEFKARIGVPAPRPADTFAPRFFRAPETLMAESSFIKRVLIVGSCLTTSWSHILKHESPPVEHDFFFFTSELPPQPARPISDYDLQIVQIPLRTVLPDMSFARLQQSDVAGHEQLFEHAERMMLMLLESALRWNKETHLLTFVLPFILPQQNPVGRLMHRYDLRNPVYFIERLNESMSNFIMNYKNCYYVELNEIISTHGRRFFQEDAIAAFNHGFHLSDYDFEFDVGRLEQAQRAGEIYEVNTSEIIQAGWQEIVAMYRTINQVDMVKMVVVDLDDTLWRGTVAEMAGNETHNSEGWPKGFWEALILLKRRGVLLAIISKNEEENVHKFWKIKTEDRINLDDFAIRRINWRPKSDNMAEILAASNLTPRNVVYIDDNPVQRSEVQSAFPDIRVLGGTPFTWRHVLLWAPETQVRDITLESANRTEMMRAQVQREDHRKAVPVEQFLASLNIQMHFHVVDNINHPQFPRVIELLNKTNQFNTTGKRWSTEECASAFNEGLRFHAFEVTDKYTSYGLVGILAVIENRIDQFVMSCRVMGLDIEKAAVTHIAGILLSEGFSKICANIQETPRNLPCRDVYARCGFEPFHGGWCLTKNDKAAMPAHIMIA